MDNALAEPQTIVLLGGTSDIGRAIVERLVTPATRTIVLAGRRPGEMRSDELARPGVTVDTVHFDAADTDTHEAFVADLVARHGDLDVVVVAFGQLVDQAELDTDPAAAAAMVTVNYTGAVSSCLARRRPVPPPGPRPARRAVERRRRAGPQGQLRLRLVEGRARRLRPGARRRPRRDLGPACSSCGPASSTRR